MRTTLIWWLAAMVCATAAVPSEAPVAEDLAWLAGCWASPYGDPGSGEQWMAPAGGSLIGTNRTVRDGKTVAYEFLRILETEEGGLAYISSPSGQSTTTFTLKELGERSFVFENPEHDFPQRIVYRLEDGGELKAHIEGEWGGELRKVDFSMKRVDCPN